MSSEKAGLDEFFERLFGFAPSKKGQGYELLVAAVWKLLHEQYDVKADQQKRGKGSKTSYQLDTHVAGPSEQFVESKDYTAREKGRGAPVGRGDLQKLLAALLDLDIPQGVFTSASGYTGPAKKFAAASGDIAEGTSIQLFDIRPSTEEDEQGRIREIHLNIGVYEPEYEKATWIPLLTGAGKAALEKAYQKGSTLTAPVAEFTAEDGTVRETIRQLTAKLHLNYETLMAQGQWSFEPGTFIDFGGVKAEIQSIDYKVPYRVTQSTMIIKAEGTPSVLVRSEDGTIDRLLTDEQLRRVAFAEDGSVVIKK
jgi:hypothetical protein